MVIEDLFNINLKTTIELMQVYEDDIEFRDYIGKYLKEKLIKNQNHNIKDLMSIIVLTLDLKDLRRDIIQYSLSNELFYAFPMGYIISIMRRIEQIGYHPDYYDLLKTMQVRLCLIENVLAKVTVEKLIFMHRSIPILNPHFLAMLLRYYNKKRLLDEGPHRLTGEKIFSLNISELDLPN